MMGPHVRTRNTKVMRVSAHAPTSAGCRFVKQPALAHEGRGGVLVLKQQCWRGNQQQLAAMAQPGRSAFTASVWGNRRAALVVSRELREGEEECAICREDAPATVALQPCRHNVCIACVETMRATNIFRVSRCCCVLHGQI